VFDVGTIRAEIMREQAGYHGVQSKIRTRLASAEPTVSLDFPLDYPHRPVVVDLPELLGGGSIRLASYPPELTLAEEIAATMSRRELNIGDRDFADVWTLSRMLTLTAATLPTAMDDVVGLSDAQAELPDRQAPYAVML
jgi:hypothetical protein